MEAHAVWLEERRRGIGGSDAGAVLGLSPWKTPLQVYLEKRGELPAQEDNESMFWGRTLEPVIRQRYSDLTGRTVIVPGKILVHPRHAFMLANVDGLTDDGRVLEIKTARMDIGWGEPGSDEIPDSYMAQVQHYMAVTGLEVSDVAVLIGGSDFRLYEVPADAELHAMMIEREAAFWEMVEAGTPPEPQNMADIKLRFGSASKDERVQATDEVLDALSRLKSIKEMAKEEDAYKATIMRHMGEADTLVMGSKVLATWKAAKGSSRFDAKAFQAAHPELYREFCRESAPSRRLLIK